MIRQLEKRPQLNDVKEETKFCWLPMITPDDRLIWLEKVVIKSRYEIVDFSILPVTGWVVLDVRVV